MPLTEIWEAFQLVNYGTVLVWLHRIKCIILGTSAQLHLDIKRFNPNWENHYWL